MSLSHMSALGTSLHHTTHNNESPSPSELSGNLTATKPTTLSVTAAASLIDRKPVYLSSETPPAAGTMSTPPLQHHSQQQQHTSQQHLNVGVNNLANNHGADAGGGSGPTYYEHIKYSN